MIKLFVNEKGFNLMELIIAVAIIVVLAGVGIPIYLKLVSGSKHSEAMTHLSAIKVNEQGYNIANGQFLSCAVAPRATPDEEAVPWEDNDDGTFAEIGFSVDGDVRFVYEVVAGDPPTTYTVAAQGDTNGDGTSILFTATNTTSPAKVTEDTDVGDLSGGPDD